MAHFYRDEIKGNGTATLKFHQLPGVPYDPRNASDFDAAQRHFDFGTGVLLDPLILGQDYPESYNRAVPHCIFLTLPNWLI